MKNEEQIAIPVTEIEENYDMSYLSMYMLGHAHIDLCYRWDIEETIHRISPMTFKGVLDVMERVSGFTFCQSQLFLYEAMEKMYPRIFEQIMKWIKRGQWEVIGGAWCEYDTMLTSGESVIRQHLQGIRYSIDTLGVSENRVAFVPDAFIAHSATLPQILSGCGINYYLFCRGLPENQKRAFKWVGPDGSHIIAYQPFGHYSNTSFTAEYVQELQGYAKNGVTDYDIALYGIGDHGGGPRDEDIQALESIKSIPEMPRWRYGTAHDFFARTFNAEVTDKLNTHTGNMPSFATGAITSQAYIKRWNRICERLLLSTESAATAATPLQYKPAYPRLDFIRLWRMLLTLQFHDTLPGTSIASVYRQAENDYKHIEKELRNIMDDSLQRIGSRIDTRGEGYPVLVYNPALREQTGLVQITYPEWGNITRDHDSLALIDSNQQEIPAFFGENGVSFIAELPSSGYALYRTVPQEKKKLVQSPPAALKGQTFENEYYSLVFDEKTGDINEIYDKIQQQTLCSSSFTLLLYEETELGTAWVQHFTGKMHKVSLVEGPVIAEQTPFLTRITIKSKSRWSTFTREVVLYHKLKRIDFSISTNWHDTDTFLKIGFHTTINNPRITAGIAHGFIEVDNPETEFCCHDWVHIGNESRGIAFLNDGSYGANFEDGMLGISVIRNVRDMDPHMDLREHTLRFSLVPQDCKFKQSLVQNALIPFLYPLETLWETDHAGPTSQWGNFDNTKPIPDTGSFVSVKEENVIICAFKMPEEYYTAEMVIIRLRELNGVKTRCELDLSLPCKSLWYADHLERPIREIKDESGMTVHPNINPYEIITLIAYL